MKCERSGWNRPALTAHGWQGCYRTLFFSTESNQNTTETSNKTRIRTSRDVDVQLPQRKETRCNGRQIVTHAKSDQAACKPRISKLRQCVLRAHVRCKRLSNTYFFFFYIALHYSRDKRIKRKDGKLRVQGKLVDSIKRSGKCLGTWTAVMANVVWQKTIHRRNEMTTETPTGRLVHRLSSWTTLETFISRKHHLMHDSLHPRWKHV